MVEWTTQDSSYTISLSSHSWQAGRCDGDKGSTRISAEDKSAHCSNADIPHYRQTIFFFFFAFKSRNHLYFAEQQKNLSPFFASKGLILQKGFALNSYFSIGPQSLF